MGAAAHPAAPGPPHRPGRPGGEYRADALAARTASTEAARGKLDALLLDGSANTAVTRLRAGTGVRYRLSAHRWAQPCSGNRSAAAARPLFVSQALSLLQTASGADDAYAVVACLVFFGPVIAPVLFLIGALVVAHRVLRARRERRPGLDTGTLVRLSLLGLCAAYEAVSTGLMSGPVWMSARKYCGVRGFPEDRITTRTFPLSMRCGPDGELVPSWVNPVLVAGLTLALAALTAAALTTYRTRRRTRAS